MLAQSEQPILEDLLARLGGEDIVFPSGGAPVEALQTHISVVLLAGDRAYKIKKPVKFPFVDYSTLEKRRNFCRQEVDLNRRLAPDVYLDVVPIVREGRTLVVEGKGGPVEWAVKMRRLPDERRIGRLLHAGGLPKAFWDKLAYRLIRFYRDAARGPEVSKWATAAAVGEDWNQILRQIRDFPEDILAPVLRKRLETLAADSLKALKGRIDRRASLAREGHGDLRLEHIYYFPEMPEPGRRNVISNPMEGSEEILLIDCVEFDPRYRCCDPLCDLAFLVMDLEAAGFGEEAKTLWEAYGRLGNEVGDGLEDFYVAYRHLVRGLVRTLQALDRDGPSGQWPGAVDKARRHFLMALSRLESPGKRPCLIILSGLPGAGKSTLARLLGEREGFGILSSDLVRKELAGLPSARSAEAEYEKGIYTIGWTQRTYGELLGRCEAALLRGEKTVVDASFHEQSRREPFQALARRLGIPFLFLTCRIGRETAERRLAAARAGASDADLGVHLRMAQAWEEPSQSLGEVVLDTERPLEDVFAEVHGILEKKGLASENS